MDTHSPLIPVAELIAALGARDLCIVDCRFDLADVGFGRRAYAEAHIPGAHYADLGEHLSGPRTADSGRHPLPSPEAFAATLARFGVTKSSRVVAYDQSGGQVAARLWWMLRAIGHRGVQVLDGGIAAWRAAGGPLTNELTPEVDDVSVAPRAFSGFISTGELVQELAADRVRLIDARTADRFAGNNETIDPVAGHVPGAVNHPFPTNLGSDGRFLDAGTLAQRWRETLDGAAPRDAVVMCGSGITACHDLLALEVARLPGARLYAGSWSEWIRDATRAIAT